MSRNKKRVIKAVLCLVLIICAIFSWQYITWRRAIAYTPNNRYNQNTGDPFLSQLSLFELPRAITSVTFRRTTRRDPLESERPLFLRALTVFSNCRNFEVIYEMRGLRSFVGVDRVWPSEHWLEANTENIDWIWNNFPSQYSAQNFDGREIFFIFDHENEIVPRIFSTDTRRYVRKFYRSHMYGSKIWIELIQKDGNMSFALSNVFSPNDFYREFDWEPHKLIAEFDFINEYQIQITYLDMLQVTHYQEIIDLWGFEINEFGLRWPISSMESVRDEDLQYLSYKIISLDSYISDISPLMDYRYNFMSSATVYEYVTQSNFSRLQLFDMTQEDVRQVFQTPGTFVEEYTYLENTFRIYGFMGQGAAIFTVFFGDYLVAAEFINPYFYNGRGTVFENQRR